MKLHRGIKSLGALLSVGVLFFTGACTSETTVKTGENNTVSESGGMSLGGMSLYEGGLKAANGVGLLLGDKGYMESLLSPSLLTSDIYKEVSQMDLSSPKACYAIEIDMDQAMKTVTDSYMSSVSKQLEPMFKSRILSAIPNIINSRQGTEVLAFSSSCNSQWCFVANENIENTAYLYVYEDKYPIYVSFIYGDDNAVDALAYLIGDKNVDVTNADTVKETLDYAKGMIKSVKEIKI